MTKHMNNVLQTIEKGIVGNIHYIFSFLKYAHALNMLMAFFLKLHKKRLLFLSFFLFLVLLFFLLTHIFRVHVRTE